MPTPTPAATLPPSTLRPYQFHGVVFDRQEGSEAFADCPSCGRADKKWSVNVDTGEHKCLVCNFHGGHTPFLRWLFEQSDKHPNGVHQAFADDRGLLDKSTLSFWSCAVSVISRAWIVGGYNEQGALVQLYKRIKTPDRWELRPTPEVGGHAVHGVPLMNKEADTVYLCEGPWDAMVLWEALRASKNVDGRLEYTANPQASMLSTCSVLAVANCGAVGDGMRKYAPLFQGKRVVLCFDHDHETEHEGRKVDGAGLAASKRAAGIMQGVAAEVWHLRWPAEKGNGFDVRDALTRVS